DCRPMADEYRAYSPMVISTGLARVASLGPRLPWRALSQHVFGTRPVCARTRPWIALYIAIGAPSLQAEVRSTGSSSAYSRFVLSATIAGVIRRLDARARRLDLTAAVAALRDQTHSGRATVAETHRGTRF